MQEVGDNALSIVHFLLLFPFTLYHGLFLPVALSEKSVGKRLPTRTILHSDAYYAIQAVARYDVFRTPFFIARTTPYRRSKPYTEITFATVKEPTVEDKEKPFHQWKIKVRISSKKVHSVVLGPMQITSSVRLDASDKTLARAVLLASEMLERQGRLSLPLEVVTRQRTSYYFVSFFQVPPIPDGVIIYRFSKDLSQCTVRQGP